MKRWLASLSFVLLTTAAHALPTVADVESEVQRGNYAQAQSLMHEVVIAKPGSARAHYVYAEILAHNGKFADAAQETALARQLDPTLEFTNPENFKAFEQLLDREQQRASQTGRSESSLDSLGPTFSRSQSVSAQPQRQAAEHGLGIPAWVWPVGLGLFAFLVWRLMSQGRGATSPAVVPGAAPYGSASGNAPMPAYGPPGSVAPSGTGSLMGMGLAAAGGVAAGMLAEKLLDRGHEQRRDESLYDRGSFTEPTQAMDSDARALESRAVDFGTGNDWDAGSADSGSVDLGGGGGDDGGW
jgi:hypothetical protein